MNVILCERVANLGEMGETVKVADGYARNYLIPRRLAVNLDSASAQQVAHELRQIRRREEKVKLHLQQVAKTLDEVTLEFRMRAGAEDKLFGSVTTGMVADQLHARGYEVDRRSVELDEPIKSLGIFTVTVKLGSGVTGEVKVWVKPEVDEEAPTLEEAAVEAVAESTAEQTAPKDQKPEEPSSPSEV